MARGLMQGPFLDQFIFTLASETSENLGNLIVGSFESVAGITQLLVAIPIGSSEAGHDTNKEGRVWHDQHDTERHGVGGI